jgi:hypothetical protein
MEPHGPTYHVCSSKVSQVGHKYREKWELNQVGHTSRESLCNLVERESLTQFDAHSDNIVE